MDRQVLIYQLISLRATVDAMLAVLTGTEPEPEVPPGCQHPEERRQNMAVMGKPNRWRCRDCGHVEGG